jgi:hypothetical protein
VKRLILLAWLLVFTSGLPAVQPNRFRLGPTNVRAFRGSCIALFLIFGIRGGCYLANRPTALSPSPMVLKKEGDSFNQDFRSYLLALTPLAMPGEIEEGKQLVNWILTGTSGPAVPVTAVQRLSAVRQSMPLLRFHPLDKDCPKCFRLKETFQKNDDPTQASLYSGSTFSMRGLETFRETGLGDPRLVMFSELFWNLSRLEIAAVHKIAQDTSDARTRNYLRGILGPLISKATPLEGFWEQYLARKLKDERATFAERALLQSVDRDLKNGKILEEFEINEGVGATLFLFRQIVKSAQTFLIEQVLNDPKTTDHTRKRLGPELLPFIQFPEISRPILEIKFAAKFDFGISEYLDVLSVLTAYASLTDKLGKVEHLDVFVEPLHAIRMVRLIQECFALSSIPNNSVVLVPDTFAHDHKPLEYFTNQQIFEAAEEFFPETRRKK